MSTGVFCRALDETRNFRHSPCFCIPGKIIACEGKRYSATSIGKSVFYPPTALPMFLLVT